MAIELLSPRLANQIAAGEVVERPASVVKELVENSLDAGATQINIDIEKGGSKLIRIRDNGCGVEKSQLTLALSRHATSKISHLDDLHSIVSLGFRGEALASISSVSRLTFTSKTSEQNEAWQAFAQGREMGVEITPAAHPTGTSVEVGDLFFNTPARRRFLRTEKTEFNHIDELIKRFALSRFDVEFVLKHNQKMLRNLKVAKTTAQQERRVAAICGNRFIDNAIAIDNDHNDIKISGWLGLPAACRTTNDTQFCYVNGRMMRDKLINHAIRQAYQDYLPEGAVPSYVLYIELDPTQVDVNVHPAKHEVRFHQSRMIHDLIAQVLASGLSQAMSAPQLDAQAQGSAPVVNPQTPAHQYTPAPTSSYSAAPVSFDDLTEPAPRSSSQPQQMPQYQPQYQSQYQPQYEREHSARDIRQGAGAYQNLMNDSAKIETPFPNTFSHVDNNPQQAQKLPLKSAAFGELLDVVEDNYLLVKGEAGFELVNLPVLARWIESRYLQEKWQQGFTSQPLLLPVSIKLDSSLLDQLENHQQLFRRLGIDINLRRPQIIVKQVPSQLRNQDIAQLIPQLLELLDKQQYLPSDELTPLICDWLASVSSVSFDLNSVNTLLSKGNEFSDELIELRDKFVAKLDFTSTINTLTNSE
ncbi:DNA mismatch repair endonuclease MutL [Psychrobium sp. MM17-31]|uniref:DNA mismatch repair endonuclease MutL n=1 Tax=Psychrobium sp. MM17-31 TaxID=2917758 RepID=UPI001EF4DE26|nr:DNA mismatch repair endonuclease MutL [Psychrobium sp. MM17-31]MCG7530530.1 DNA mismatch repair endonuclease MutL [Psychrobium sp. MM17-31]